MEEGVDDSGGLAVGCRAKKWQPMRRHDAIDRSEIRCFAPTLVSAIRTTCNVKIWKFRHGRSQILSNSHHSKMHQHTQTRVSLSTGK
jgi:hypothetical protein